ncbi:hypothetical protein [Leptobacterium sp. I13]|uniref:hypothetical protein n=1 Tax=Leptobacterium meishanense TaxID=3128904 RepID=UPI0030EDEC33
MATKKSITVYERILKKVKGKPVTERKEVKTDDTEEGVKKTIHYLQKKGIAHFEVDDNAAGLKRIYTKTLSGKNYEIKTIKL